MSRPSRSPFIVGPRYDWIWFLLPPLASLGVGIAISGTAFSDGAFTVAGEEFTTSGLLIGTIIHAHLVAVAFRSHANPTIRPLHPIRFWVVPVVLWALIVASPWLAITASVIATFWDVWHSGAQTFGLARIYDRNLGNRPEVGRKLDLWLNQLLYAGPILGGVTLIDHVDSFERFHDVGTTFFCAIPVAAASYRRWLALAFLAAGTLFLIVYVVAYVRLARRGYRVSPHKVFLLATTGACSIYTWGLNSWGEAFFIMNLFHGVQYLALVWATEKGHLMRSLALRGRAGAVAMMALYLGIVLAYGGATQFVTDGGALWALTIVVSLCHFWYDGFVWSVARKQV